AGDFQPLLARSHVGGAPIVRRSFLDEIAVLNQLLHVVGDVGPEVVAPLGQLSDGKLALANVEQDEGLHVIEIPDAALVDFGLDDFKTLPVQSLNHSYSLNINGFHAPISVHYSAQPNPRSPQKQKHLLASHRHAIRKKPPCFKPASPSLTIGEAAAPSLITTFVSALNTR